MPLQIYQQPEDEGEPPPPTAIYVKLVLRIFSEEEREEPTIIHYVSAQQRVAYQRPLYVSPWDPADTF